VLSLSVLQGVSYLLPLIVLPYLVRTLGVDKFGLVVFAQATIQFFIILSDFGFNLSATREIAANRDKPEKLAMIFSAVMANRLLIMVAGFGLLWLLVSLVPRFAQNSGVFLISYGMVLGNVLFPVWVFQGLERMKLSTILVLLARFVFVILIFIVVRTPEDYLLVPVLNSIGWIVSGLIGLWLVVSRLGIGVRLPGWSDLWNHLRSSSQFFLSRLSTTIYGSMNAIVLGFATNDATVGYYVAAEKIFVAMRGAFQPLVQALYPFMAAGKDMLAYKRMFWFAVGASFIGGTIVFFISADLVRLFFGDQFQVTAGVLRVFCAAVPVVAISIMLGYPLLAALGHERYANFSIAAGSVFHLILVIMLIPVITPTRLAALVLVTESLILAIRIHGVRRYRLWSQP